MAVVSKKMAVSLFSVLLFVFFIVAVARNQKDGTLELRFVLCLILMNFLILHFIFFFEGKCSVLIMSFFRT